VTIHTRAPLSSSTGCTVPCPRRFARPGGGSNGRVAERSSSSTGISRRIWVGDSVGRESVVVCSPSVTPVRLPRSVQFLHQCMNCTELTW
jgi:hypothetical protein